MPFDCAQDKLYGHPPPRRVHLGVDYVSRAEQIARVMLEQQADLVLVVSDVNSTLACTLVCAKIGVPVAHMEAGLCSCDPSASSTQLSRSGQAGEQGSAASLTGAWARGRMEV